MCTCKNVIDVQVKSGSGEGEWFITFVYRAPERHERYEVMEKVKQLKGNGREFWVCVGDFNLIASSTEKGRGHTTP